MAALTWLITGASRGIGLEFVRQVLLANPANRVIAGVRNPSGAHQLQSLIDESDGRAISVQLDVTSEESVKNMVSFLTKHELCSTGIDVLLNNAGINSGGWKPTSKYSIQNYKETLATNLYGVINVTTSLLPLLRKGSGKRIYITSSIMGCIGSTTLSQAAPYAVSKASVNMWATRLARELESENFTIIPFHPGYVQTDMTGGPNGPAPVTPHDSVSQALQTLAKKKPSDSGTFCDYQGKPLPW